MAREGSTLSPMVRDAWDGVPMGRVLAREQAIVHMEAVRFTWLLAWRVRIGVCAGPLCGSRGSRGSCRIEATTSGMAVGAGISRDAWSALAIAVTYTLRGGNVDAA